jgi:hypothetical protein
MKNIHTEQPTAIKEHKCDYCGFKINKGEKYQKSFNSDEGDVWTWKNHLDCEKLCHDMGMFKEVPEGVSYDCFWNYVFEYFKDYSGMNINEKANEDILEWVKNYINNNKTK